MRLLRLTQGHPATALAAYSALFFVLSALSTLTPATGTRLALLWLPTAVAVVFELRTRGRQTALIGFALLGATFAWHLVHATPLAEASLRALANVATLVVVAYLAARTGLRRERLSQTKSFLTAVMVFVIAVLGVGGLVAAPMVWSGAAPSAWEAWRAYVLANLGAACIILPLGLTTNRLTLWETLQPKALLALAYVASAELILALLVLRFDPTPRLAIVTGLTMAAVFLSLLGAVGLTTVTVVFYGIATFLIPSTSAWLGLAPDLNLLATALMIFGPTIVALIREERMQERRAVRRANRQLQHQRRDLQDIVRAQTADLRDALARAQQASVQKDQFLANTSHEMRTPLHAIGAFARMGTERMQQGRSEKAAGYFERIAQSSDRLLHFVNNLLDLSRLLAKKAPLKPGRVEVHTLIGEALSAMEGALQAKQQRCAVYYRTELSAVTGDARMLNQVLANLLSNASKFCAAGSEISVYVEDALLPDGCKALRVRVDDQGVGIPQDELEKIFDNFYQSTRTATNAGGTGLGLAICKEIVLLHGGAISAANRPEGGARFDVLLPL